MCVTMSQEGKQNLDCESEVFHTLHEDYIH